MHLWNFPQNRDLRVKRGHGLFPRSRLVPPPTGWTPTRPSTPPDSTSAVPWVLPSTRRGRQGTRGPVITRDTPLFAYTPNESPTGEKSGGQGPCVGVKLRKNQLYRRTGVRLPDLPRPRARWVSRPGNWVLVRQKHGTDLTPPSEVNADPPKSTTADVFSSSTVQVLGREDSRTHDGENVRPFFRRLGGCRPYSDGSGAGSW